MPSVLTLPVSYTNVETVYETLPLLRTAATSVTSAEIALQAGQAQAYINTRLAAVYDLPFTSDVPVLNELATDLTVYRLLVKRMFLGASLEDSPWPDRFKEIQETLDSIVKGEFPLITASLSVIATAGSRPTVWSNTMDYDPIYFDGGLSEDLRVDPDRTEDSYSDRY